MTCPDICTAEKCQELERRIGALEQAIELLEASFETHTQQNIPQAHNYSPEVTVNVTVAYGDIAVLVRVDDNFDVDSAKLPEHVESNLRLSASFQSEILTVEVSVGDESGSDTFAVNFDDIDFDIDLTYFNDWLTAILTINGDTKRDSVYIDPDIIRRGPGGNGGNNDMGCEQIGQQLEQDLGEILAAIGSVSSQVQQVQQTVTIDITGTTVTDFVCPVTDEEGNTSDSMTELTYQGAGLAGLHQLTKTINQNLLTIFEGQCLQGDGALAFPAWWQTRLGANTPQIVCSFRKGSTRTYHSLAIPHPANTEQPIQELLPSYIKGNWQGMIVCKDNSKFIINCETKQEAERMCGIAAQLIDPAYLELPPRIYVGERKGQAVGIAPMLPATISYFETGQQNFIPNWRVRVADF